MQFFGRTLVVAVAGCFALLIASGAAATAQGGGTPTSDFVNQQDQSIAQQEQTLNEYRCQFNVDTEAVPGGCSNGQPAENSSPSSQFEGTPTQSDIDKRDELIDQQAKLLNKYRCQFNVDTEAVPGGCANTQPVGNPVVLQSDTQPVGNPVVLQSDTQPNVQPAGNPQDQPSLGQPCPSQPHLTCVDNPINQSDGESNIVHVEVFPQNNDPGSYIVITKPGESTDDYDAPGVIDSDEDDEDTQTWQDAVDDAVDDEDLVVIYMATGLDSSEVQQNKVRLEDEVYERGDPYVICQPAIKTTLEDGTVIDRPESCIVVTPK